METWDAITARRDVRRYADRPLADDDLDRILEAGRRAPSSRNRQQWDFVLVTERELLRRLAGVWRGAAHVAGAAAAIALVAPVEEEAWRRESIQFDLGQAAMSMLLAATDLGIGSGHAYVDDQQLARRLLGHPEDRFCALLIPLGYPADGALTPLRRPDRRPFDDVVHRGRW